MTSLSDNTSFWTADLQWTIARAGFHGLPEPSLIGSIVHTLGFNLEAEGFIKWSTLRGRGIPTPRRFALNLSSRHDADIVDGQVPSTNVLFGAAFQDPLPDEWWDRVHARGRCLVVIGSVIELSKELPPTVEEYTDRLSRAYIADVPLMLFGYDSGVGSHNEQNQP